MTGVAEPHPLRAPADEIATDERQRDRSEQDLDDGVKAVGPDTPAGDRLGETRRFFEFLRHEGPRVMARWRELR